MFKPASSLTVNNATVVLRDGLAAIAAGQSEIDLSDVTLVDSSAVATVLGWRREAQRRGVALTFGVLPPNLQSLADLYGVARLLQGTDIAPTSATDRHH